MNNTIKITSCILCFVILFGCNTTKTKKADQKVETKIVTDCVGRKVEIPKNPKRVVCMYAASAHMVALMGHEKCIVGSPGGVRRDVLLSIKYPGIKNISVPFQSGIINIEELLSINAQVAFVRKSTADNKTETDKLKKAGIPYLVIDFLTIDEVENAVKVVGEVFEEQEKADSYIKYMNDTIKYVEDGLKGLNDKDKLTVYHSSNEATKTDVKDGLCDEITRKSGVKNVSLGSGSVTKDNSKYATLEEIYVWDSDAIIVNDYYVSNYIRTNKKWKGLKAVRDNKVVTLPNGATRWCHLGSIEPHMGVLFIATTFYPERFKSFDLKNTVKDYYTKYWDIKVDDKLANNIITGEGMRIQK